MLYLVCWRFSSFGLMSFLGFLSLCVLYFICYVGLNHAAQTNSSQENYFDLFVVTCATQFIAAISSWGYLLLLIIPSYLTYIVSKQFIALRPAPKPIEETFGNDKEKADSAPRKGFRLKRGQKA